MIEQYYIMTLPQHYNDNLAIGGIVAYVMWAEKAFIVPIVWQYDLGENLLLANGGCDIQPCVFCALLIQ